MAKNDSSSTDDQPQAPAQPEPPAQPDPTVPDARDTNAPIDNGPADDTEVTRQFADGSTEETTHGALSEDHGDALGGPSTADLNPAYYPAADTATDGADDSDK